MTGSVSKSDPARQSGARRLAVAAVLIGALLGILITVFAGESQRRFVFDNWQRAAPRTLATDEVVVVLIDDASVEKHGQWPWLRIDIALLLDQISRAQPSAIGIDIYFPQEDPMRPEAFANNYTDEQLDPGSKTRVLDLPNWDDALAAILQRADAPTVLARVGVPNGGTSADMVAFDYLEGSPPAGTPSFPNVLTSIDKFDSGALSRGFVNGAPDPDGVVRRVPLAVGAGESFGSGFAIELAKVHGGVDTLRWDGRELALGERRIVSDDHGTMQFKMGRYSDEDIVQALDVLAGEIEPGRFRGKVVILGLSATGTYDIVATPLGAEVPGPIVQAQAVDAILKGEWLSAPDWLWWMEIVAAAVLLGLLLSAAFTFRNGLLVAAGVIALSLPLISWLLYAQSNLLFDPARPIIVALLGGIGLLLARYALALQELVQQRVREAEQKREEDNARRLQKRMVPSRDRLAELGSRTQIGAELFPAKSVGGDFYDAFELPDDRLLFLVGDVSGKGLGAALFMAFSKTAAKAKFLSTGSNLDEAVMALNDELSLEEDEEMDLTMLVGLIDCKTGTVELVNAGHENPLLVKTDNSVEEVKLVGGPRLRTIYDFPYSVETVHLSPGETLVVITDGATDAENARQVKFGLSGVITTLQQQSRSTAQQRATELADTVRRFEGNADPADDLTILALQYLGE